MWYHNGVHLADLLRQQRPELEASMACDPGVTWGWTMVSDSDRGPACQDVQQCSGGQWYQIAGITQRKAFMQGKVRQQPGFEAWQAQIPASCTGSEQGLLRRAGYLMAGLQRISAVYGQRSQRTQRWRSVIRQEQCIQDAVRSMVTGPDGRPLPREQVVVGWGSGGSSSGGAIPRKPGGLPLRRLAEAPGLRSWTSGRSSSALTSSAPASAARTAGSACRTARGPAVTGSGRAGCGLATAAAPCGTGTSTPRATSC
jgi:hypothetical protein